MPRYSPISHSRRDNRQCLRCKHQPVMHHDGVWYSLCKSCLRQTQLGPFKKRPGAVGQEYSQW